MDHPQTFAEELYRHFPTTKLKMIKENACCAFTLLWYLGIDPMDITAILTVSNLMDKHALDVDCTVYWAECVKALTGRTLLSLEKKPIKSIKDIKEKTIVKFSRGKLGHWVGVENGRVVFNSLNFSRCVEEGTPTECRILKISGVN